MKLFCMSDTHGGPPPAKALSLPHGTVMLHAGDFYNEGSTKVHSDWTKVIGGDTGNDILMVRGNHDCVETDFINIQQVQQPQTLVSTPVRLVPPISCPSRVNRDVVQVQEQVRQLLLEVQRERDRGLLPGPLGHDLTMGFSRVEKTWIVGLGWCGQEYNQLPTESLMTKLVLRLLDACSNTFKDGDRSILVTHYLPTGPYFKNCEGWEFKSINSLIDAIRPMAVIAGHRHGLAGKTFYQGDVPIIFPGPKGGWLEVEESGVKWS